MSGVLVVFMELIFVRHHQWSSHWCILIIKGYSLGHNDDCRIGPFTVANDDCSIGPFTVVNDDCRIGPYNVSVVSYKFKFSIRMFV